MTFKSKVSTTELSTEEIKSICVDGWKMHYFNIIDNVYHYGFKKSLD